MHIDPIPRIRARSLPLAACLLAALATAHADAAAERHRSMNDNGFAHPTGALPVTSCADDGSAGTLRSVVAGAVSGDTIDLTSLTCGTITLESGAIPIAVDELTIVGPGANQLTIDGADLDRVITHNGTGTLAISGVSIVHGRNATGSGLGGCIYSAGPVRLTSTTVASCSTLGGSGFFAGGGGLVAVGGLTLESSTISGNVAERAGTGNYVVIGGAAFVVGSATVVDSTISGNATVGLDGTSGYKTYGGGLVVNGPLVVSNSTIAFNAAGRGAGGIFSLGYGIEMQSSIVANNISPYAGYFSADIGGYGSMTGANNLIIASDLIVPADTLNADPALLPLADNGGPTETHALAPDSPAIDVGNNAASLPFDQRGPGYLRVSGLAADIGAFELQQTFAVPTVAKSFVPDTIGVQDPTTLTITPSNANPLAATLTADLVDNLPSPVVVADPLSATTTCPGGSVVATAGGTSVTLTTGAQIPADDSCTVTVTVTSATAGTFTNVIPAGALQTDQGADASPASASLTVTSDAPTLTKSFSPDQITAGTTTQLTLTLGNANPVAGTLTADLSDVLPPSLSVADLSGATTTCPGGTVDAEAGATTVTLAAGAEIPAEASCTVTVSVNAILPGVFTNTIPAGALQTTLGSSAVAASANLTVTEDTDHIFADGFDAPAASAD